MTDINDKNPEFRDQPYLWNMTEGPAGRYVGRVRAVDADDGINAHITYSAPPHLPFAVNPVTGDITNQAALDFERERVSRQK